MTERKKALVTGGATGIGRSAVLALAGAGYDIAINYGSNKAAAEAVAKEAQGLGAKTLLVQCDVSNDAAVRQMMATIDASTDAMASRTRQLSLLRSPVSCRTTPTVPKLFS